MPGRRVVKRDYFKACRGRRESARRHALLSAADVGSVLALREVSLEKRGRHVHNLRAGLESIAKDGFVSFYDYERLEKHATKRHGCSLAAARLDGPTSVPPSPLAFRCSSRTSQVTGWSTSTASAGSLGDPSRRSASRPCSTPWQSHGSRSEVRLSHGSVVASETTQVYDTYVKVTTLRSSPTRSDSASTPK